MNFNNDPEWLKRKAEAEDGCEVSVGGSAPSKWLTPEQRAEIAKRLQGKTINEGMKRLDLLDILASQEAADAFLAEQILKTCIAESLFQEARVQLAEKDARIAALEKALAKELALWTIALRPSGPGTIGYGVDGEFIENRVLTLRAAIGAKS